MSEGPALPLLGATEALGGIPGPAFWMKFWGSTEVLGSKALDQILDQSGLFGGPSREDVSLKDTWLRQLLDCPEGVPRPRPLVQGYQTTTGLYQVGMQTANSGKGIRSLSSLNLTLASLTSTPSWYHHSLEHIFKPESTHSELTLSQ